MATHETGRRALLRALAVAVPAGAAVSLTGCLDGNDARAATADPGPEPGGQAAQPWQSFATVEEAGFSKASIDSLEAALYPLETTSLMIVRHGKIAYRYGNIDDVAYLASARKSILSMLYGKYVEDGTIDLDKTMGDLGIDDNAGLLPIEKTAKIRHVLTATSGVYHPAGSPGGSANTPERGSVTPGTQFLYNNWDFNVAGAIFEKLTGRTIFDAFAKELAEPLGMEDFDPSRQRMLGYKTNASRYLAYHFFLSARDMARLGVLMANKGNWNGRQIVPASWVADSTSLHVPMSQIGGERDCGYGYLWWLPSESRSAVEWQGSFLANGNYGQFILVLPNIDTVIVHRRSVTDEFAVARNLGNTDVNKAGVNANAFLKLVDGALVGHV
ncbi:serine hydrolase [Pigmentiphaga sp. D-2]|uniref:serine hydrolase domain-containing protein n=1 Tax=Pigmentiphaga sp. D-2 TaxID=1002116 RepID=UPI001049CD08|nr:serine hydrolase [Pigmentiphaga sp. D-2]